VTAFDWLFGDMFGGLLGGCAAPPDSVPLRILNLAEIPSGHDRLKSAFRTRLLAVHPDVVSYDAVPELQAAARAAAMQRPEVAELVWARDVLLRKVPAADPDGVTDSNVAHGRQYEPSRCKVCGEPWTDWRSRPIGAHLLSDEDRRMMRTRTWMRPRWEGYCQSCASDAENARQRDLRREDRANRACESCSDTFTPPRADGRYCSPACRQKAYRQRKAAP